MGELQKILMDVEMFGFTMGEGGGISVVEAEQSIRQLILEEKVGQGMTGDTSCEHNRFIDKLDRKLFGEK